MTPSTEPTTVGPQTLDLDALSAPSETPLMDVLHEHLTERAAKETARYGRTLNDYERGWIEGLTAYAWWKDGTEYVGTCGTTKTQAIQRFIGEGHHA